MERIARRKAFSRWRSWTISFRRIIRSARFRFVNKALGQLNCLFNTIYADSRRDSIALEKLMRALLLQVFYSIRLERQPMEQMKYRLMFLWLVGLSLDDTVWNHSVSFT